MGEQDIMTINVLVERSRFATGEQILLLLLGWPSFEEVMICSLENHSGEHVGDPELRLGLTLAALDGGTPRHLSSFDTMGTAMKLNMYKLARNRKRISEVRE
jgi:hypothetical protein